MKKTALLFAFTFLVSFVSMAQPEAKKGKYAFMKGQKTLSLAYDYSNMDVGKKLTEAEYIEKKVSEYNEKEAGRGDEWKASWVSSRTERYQPKFETLINKSMEKVGIVASEGADAKYTLLVRTIFTEPGFNVGVMRKPAFVNFEMVFTETATNSEVATYLLSKIPGSQAMGYDFDAGSRIAESYAKGGKMIGAYIAKGVK